MSDEETTALLAGTKAASEIATRLGGIVLLTVYGTGFLILSLHNASYGIAEFNLLKPRIFAAGTLLVLLTTLPAVAAVRLKLAVKPEPSSSLMELLYRGVQRYTTLALTALGLAFAGRFLFEGSFFAESWRSVYVLIAAAVSVTIFLVTRKKAGSLISVTLSIAALIFLSVAVIRDQDSPVSLLTGWFFITGVITDSLKDTIHSPSKSKEMEWERLVLYTISFVSAFSVFLYGRARAQYGGGAPIPVVIFTSQKSPLMESESQQFLLVDENEQGFYLVTSKGEKRAIFLPRGSVSGIYFGQDFAASKK